MLYGFLVQSNNSWFQQIVPSERVSHLGKLRWFKMVVVTEIWWVTNHRTEDVCSHCFLTANRPTNFYVGVTSQPSEPTLLVQYLLANLTGSVINITQENCQNQREDEDDKESKHVRLLTIYNIGKKLNAKAYFRRSWCSNILPSCLKIVEVLFKFMNCIYWFDSPYWSYTINLTLVHVELVLNSVIPPPPLSFSQIYTYMWVQGSTPPNGTEQQSFCVRSTVHLSKALSPAFDLKEYTSKDYSTWTESRWKSIKGRIFLVASHDLEVNHLQASEILVHSLLTLDYHQKMHFYQ